MADHTDLLRQMGWRLDMMLMRTDPFRDLDRFTQQVLGTAARPAVMPIDAWRDGERNVLTVRAERPGRDQNREMLAAERPRGVFSRQLFLGDNLDTDKIDANYHDGVLRLTIPIAEKAKPRRIQITSNNEKTAINA